MPISANSFSILVPEFLKVKNCVGWKRENSAKMAENTGSQGKRGDLKKERKKSKTAVAAVCWIQVKIRLKLEK